MARLTIELVFEGYPCTLTLQGPSARRLLRRVASLTKRLKALGFEARQTLATQAPEASPPLCPEHQGPMKPSRFGGFYCPRKGPGGEYCKHKIKPGEAAEEAEP